MTWEKEVNVTMPLWVMLSRYLPSFSHLFTFLGARAQGSATLGPSTALQPCPRVVPAARAWGLAATVLRRLAAHVATTDMHAPHDGGDVLSVISHTHLILVMCAVVQLMPARAVSCSSRFVVR